VRLPSGHVATHGSSRKGRQERHRGQAQDEQYLREMRELGREVKGSRRASGEVLQGPIKEEEEDEEEDDEEDGKSGWTRATRREETKEEKRLRKAAVKEAQRIARRNKKSLRGVYRGEEVRAAGVGVKAGALREGGALNPGVSVFRY
jgi:hypothetical protein